LFLISYAISLQAISWAASPETNAKGKGKISEGKRMKTDGEMELPRPHQSWTVPPEGWIKLNTDAGVCPNTGAASAGMIACDEGGKVLLTTWRTLKCCSSLEEAEVGACLEGIRLMVEWINKPTCMESDCSSLIQALDKTIKRTYHVHMGSSSIYCTHKLTKFMKKSEKKFIHILFILLHLCIKFQC
jgi:hypothetical protein